MKGLYKRYNVTKIEGETDPEAKYFVMRYDHKGGDETHVRACQVALLVYSNLISDHLPQLADDLTNDVVPELKRMSSN